MNYLVKLLDKLFVKNHEEKEDVNPNSAYLICFTEKQLNDYVDEVKSALLKLNRRYILIDAKGKTYLNIVNEISGHKLTTNREAL